MVFVGGLPRTAHCYEAAVSMRTLKRPAKPRTILCLSGRESLPLAKAARLQNEVEAAETMLRELKCKSGCLNRLPGFPEVYMDVENA